MTETETIAWQKLVPLHQEGTVKQSAQEIVTAAHKQQEAVQEAFLKFVSDEKNGIPQEHAQKVMQQFAETMQSTDGRLGEKLYAAQNFVLMQQENVPYLTALKQAFTQAEKQLYADLDTSPHVRTR